MNELELAPGLRLAERMLLMQSALRQWIAAAGMAIVLATLAPVGPVAAEVDRQVDINTASTAELASLPGIGESKAQAIVEHRAADPFQTIEDLKKVKGIGDKTFESLRPHLMVSQAAPKKAQD
jgi:competence protein ComEA